MKKKCFGLIVALVPTIHKARSIHTMAKWPFINILVSKLTIFDPLPLLLAGRRSLPEGIYNPVMTLGFRKCLPVSWTTLRGKHFWHPIAVMEVVAMFGQKIPICFLKPFMANIVFKDCFLFQNEINRKMQLKALS